MRWLTPSTRRRSSLKRNGLASASTWITYIDHLSATRTIISRATQLVAVCSTSGGTAGTAAAAAVRRDSPAPRPVVREVGRCFPFVAIGYSDVTRARSRAFLSPPRGVPTLPIVTKRNLGTDGHQ